MVRKEKRNFGCSPYRCIKQSNEAVLTGINQACVSVHIVWSDSKISSGCSLYTSFCGFISKLHYNTFLLRSSPHVWIGHIITWAGLKAWTSPQRPGADSVKASLLHCSPRITNPHLNATHVPESTFNLEDRVYSIEFSLFLNAAASFRGAK